MKIEVLAEKIDSMREKVDEMHECLFGNGDYKNNLVADVQKNTTFRKDYRKQKSRSWAFWVLILIALIEGGFAIAIAFMK